MNARDLPAYPAAAQQDTERGNMQPPSLTAGQAIDALSAMLCSENEYSEIQLRCPAGQYCASAIALAAEDADAAVLWLVACPAPQGGSMLDVYLRINRLDPSRTVRSLERRGFSVCRARGAEYADEDLSRERLNELQHYLNI